MPSILRSLLPLLAAVFIMQSAEANASALYVNNYGSGWGLWLRGHYFLRETDNGYVLEVERISLEPNREYPQSFKISGFKLAYYFQDRESGESPGPRSGCRTAGALSRHSSAERTPDRGRCDRFDRQVGATRGQGSTDLRTSRGHDVRRFYRGAGRRILRKVTKVLQPKGIEKFARVKEFRRGPNPARNRNRRCDDFGS